MSLSASVHNERYERDGIPYVISAYLAPADGFRVGWVCLGCSEKAEIPGIFSTVEKAVDRARARLLIHHYASHICPDGPWAQNPCSPA
jgi:hypothetical protein